jgi:hypothetical protein
MADKREVLGSTGCIASYIKKNKNKIVIIMKRRRRKKKNRLTV